MFSSHCSPHRSTRWHECETALFCVKFYSLSMSASTGMNIGSFVAQLIRISVSQKTSSMIPFNPILFLFTDRVAESLLIRTIRCTMTTACTSVDDGGTSHAKQCDAIDPCRCRTKQCARDFASLAMPFHCVRVSRLISTECVICLISNYIVSECQRYRSPYTRSHTEAYDVNDLPQIPLLASLSVSLSLRIAHSYRRHSSTPSSACVYNTQCNRSRDRSSSIYDTMSALWNQFKR